MDTNTILDKAIEDVRKRHGVQIMTLSSIKADEVDSISTGSLSLDVATGVLGIPRGRIIEIYGPESSGKTTVCFSIVREAQSKGLRCLYIDMEQAVDVAYARKLGVDLQSLYFVQPESAEMALDIAETFLKNSAMDLIVIDSVASLVPQAEIENSMGESTMGLQARLMGQALRKLTPLLRRNNATLVFTNQLRQKIGVYFGNPEVTPGGLALKFYASIRIELRKVQEIKSAKGETVGVEVKATIRKNKVSAPGRKAQFRILYGEGVDRIHEILEIGKIFGVIEMPNNRTYEYNGEVFARSREQARQYLLDNPSVAQQIEAEIRRAMSETGNEGLLGADDDDSPLSEE